jgi:hypothetical protein
MTEPSTVSADDDTPMSDDDLRELLMRARTLPDPRLARLVTSYVTLRRVTADVIAGIEARDGGAAVAKNPLLLRARELSTRFIPPKAP